MRALVLAALVATACSGGGDGSCPGELVGTFLLHGVLDESGTRCDVEPPGGFVAIVRDTAPEIGPFVATLAQDPTDAPTRTAALCTPTPLASPYFGARQPDGTYVLDAASGAAVLPQCGATCSTSATEHITGTLTYADGRPVSFDGTLTETFDYRGGDCGICSQPADGATPAVPLHCEARYVLTTMN